MDLFHTSRSSIADLIALSVYVSVANCGGPRIPLRVGRRDADGPGVLTAPMVHQDLETHKAIFFQAGFTAPQDMVTLVACGHTLGGVHPANFPSVVGPETMPRRRVVPFEQAPGSSFLFDNGIVLEHLSGTGGNPLVHSHNDTTNSDKRIFGADGNVTMRELADLGVFQARCADLFGHMLDLVPRHVVSELSIPLKPIDMKPYIREQSLQSDGNIHLHGRIRVRIGGPSGRSGHDVRVRLDFKDRAGRPTRTVEAMRAKRAGGLSQGHFGDEFVWFEFAVAVPSGSGLASFNVIVINSSDDTSELFENGGHGFPVPDTLLYQVRQSCLNSTVKDGHMHLHVVAAVRRGQETMPPPILRLDLRSPREGAAVKIIDSVSIPFVYSGLEQHGYDFYNVDTPVPLSSWNTRFDIRTDSGNTVEFKPTNVLRSNNACGSFL
ncbi:Peroxidase [Microdochium nivale]|nr:Peroxidase [Microdochium nivale]